MWILLWDESHVCATFLLLTFSFSATCNTSLYFFISEEIIEFCSLNVHQLLLLPLALVPALVSDMAPNTLGLVQGSKDGEGDV